MRLAVDHDVDGIIGQCGGAAQCGTCHIYVEESAGAPFPPIDEVEDDVLDDVAAPRADNSRLGCQLPLTEGDQRLVVKVPTTQL
ncbi:2Fe-2S iron-sulfur cluster-binding protein [Enemella evansiae]|uniref:2Fe-2S iron-sulfur cluster-binding protein n=1 Tax=Enemella evansiae TaxID=2016499 RepID=UPI003983275C